MYVGAPKGLFRLLKKTSLLSLIHQKVQNNMLKIRNTRISMQKYKK